MEDQWGSTLVRVSPDPFVAAVETARRRLGAAEGKDVSVRELIRRAGYTEAERAKITYHLVERSRRGGHKVPPELVERLAPVLGMPYEELRRQALLAAGYTVEEPAPPSGDYFTPPEVLAVVQRFLGDPDVSDEEKAATTARLLEEIARRVGR